MDNAQLTDWIGSSLIVNTVDSFQGQEADFVFVSMVRSSAAGSAAKAKGLGFAEDSRRANVMLSQQAMFIFGDAVNVVKSAKDNDTLIPALARYASEIGSMLAVQSNTTFCPFIVTQAAHSSISGAKTKRGAILVAPRVIVEYSEQVPTAIASTTQTFLDRVYKIVVENSGVCKLAEIDRRIPVNQRPAKFKALHRPIYNDPRLCIAEIEDNAFIVVAKSVVEAAAAHFTTLLRREPDFKLSIQALKERTNCSLVRKC